MEPRGKKLQKLSTLPPFSSTPPAIYPTYKITDLRTYKHQRRNKNIFILTSRTNFYDNIIYFLQNRPLLHLIHWFVKKTSSYKFGNENVTHSHEYYPVWQRNCASVTKLHKQSRMQNANTQLSIEIYFNTHPRICV